MYTKSVTLIFVGGWSGILTNNNENTTIITAFGKPVLEKWIHNIGVKRKKEQINTNYLFVNIQLIHLAALINLKTWIDSEIDDVKIDRL